MYQTTKDFIAAARVLKEALLYCLIVDKPIRIETSAAGCVPCIPSVPYRTIINNHLSMQAIDPNKSQPAPDRRLKNDSQPLKIFCNYDCETALMLQNQREHAWIFLDIRGDKAPAVSSQIFERFCYSVTLRMPPDAVKELLEFVAEDPAFEPGSIQDLRQRYASAPESFPIAHGTKLRS
jgi:hypothetical protein